MQTSATNRLVFAGTTVEYHCHVVVVKAEWHHLETTDSARSVCVGKLAGHALIGFS